MTECLDGTIRIGKRQAPTPEQTNTGYSIPWFELM
jgi:hypothetical protein